MNEKIPNAAENKETIKPHYTAMFVKDISALLAQFQPRHQKIFGHHSTIAYRPDSLDGINVGAETAIRVIGRAQDEKAMHFW